MKDKVTPELKNAFKDIIHKTKEYEKEYGFYMCVGKGDRLFPSKIKCEGSICHITTEIKPETCPGKIQGFFHAHPQKPILEIIFKRKISDEEIMQRLINGKERSRKLGITLQSPSHKDALLSFLNKCRGETEGTTCTASDLETDKVECWTPKKGATNFITCNYARLDNKFTKKIGDMPKKWISRLYDKEVIQL